MAFAAVALFLIRTGANRVNAAQMAMKRRLNTLALRPIELEPSPTLTVRQNAALAYDKERFDLGSRRKNLVAILDGRARQQDWQVLQTTLRDNREVFGRLRNEIRKPACHFTFEPAKLERRYQLLSDLAMVNAARAVMLYSRSNLFSNRRYLREAARIGEHAGQDGFYHGLKAHSWVRLCILKAMDRIGEADRTTLNLLGPHPTIRQSLRGELVLAMDQASKTSLAQPWMKRAAGSFVADQIIRHWQRFYSQLPMEGGEYDLCLKVMTDFRSAARATHFLDRLIPVDYLEAIKLAKEAKILQDRLTKR